MNSSILKPMVVAGLAIAAALAPTVPASAARSATAAEQAWCGTHRDGLVDSLAVHDRNLLRLARQRTAGGSVFAAASASSMPEVTAVGNVAKIVDNGTIVVERNLFDLDNSGRRFTFRRRAGAYKIGNLGSAIGNDLGDRLPLTDDDSIAVDLPFVFKFYGVKHSRVFVNSDGNLTFGGGDSASSDRDLGRVLNGRPRIAPLFEDFNPEDAAAEGGIFVRFINNKKARFTWYRVPRFGIPNVNTFQVEISKNGQIKFRYNQVDSSVGIVGIAPGGSSAFNVVDLSDAQGVQHEAAIAEVFAETETVDEPMLAQAFYSRFADDYTHLILFTEFPIILGSLGTIAYQRNISNSIRGLGLPVFDAGPIFGSSRPLESFVMMGHLSKYDQDVRTRQFINDLFSGLDVLLHEIGHRWLFFASVRGNGLAPDQLRGRGDAHWSFYTHSAGSLLEGSFYEPQGNDAYLTTDAPRRYNDFDLYLLGALRASQVGDLFTLLDIDTDKGSRAPSANDTVVSENVVDVSIAALQAAEGDRLPSASNAQQSFRMAVIVLGKAGAPPSDASIAKAARFAAEMAREFRAQTGMRIRTKLLPK